jgi:hypothetical protein
MYTQTLVDKSVNDGERLLRALEDHSLNPKAAFWYFNPELDRWKLMISLPLMDTGNHQHAYRVVEETRMATNPEVVIPLSDVQLQSSHSLLVGAVRAAVRGLPANLKSGFHYVGETVNNQFIGDVYIYRV